jgi:hypothetical protein
MRYAAIRDPASLPVTQRVLAIPSKRFDQPVLGYLTREQVAAILEAPDQRTWNGHRDAVMASIGWPIAHSRRRPNNSKQPRHQSCPLLAVAVA